MIFEPASRESEAGNGFARQVLLMAAVVALVIAAVCEGSAVTGLPWWAIAVGVIAFVGVAAGVVALVARRRAASKAKEVR